MQRRLRCAELKRVRPYQKQIAFNANQPGSRPVDAFNGCLERFEDIGEGSRNHLAWSYSTDSQQARFSEFLHVVCELPT